MRSATCAAISLPQVPGCGVRLRSVAFRPIASALVDAGAHPSGTEHGHAYAERLEVHGETLRHGDDRELARRVRAKSEPANHARHGGSIDEVTAFAMGADVRQEGMHAVEHAHQVDVKHPPPVVERNVVDAAAAGDAGVVADNMDVSERLI